jgi:hypothetical protein
VQMIRLHDLKTVFRRLLDGGVLGKLVIKL